MVWQSCAREAVIFARLIGSKQLNTRAMNGHRPLQELF